MGRQRKDVERLLDLLQSDIALMDEEADELNDMIATETNPRRRVIEELVLRLNEDERHITIQAAHEAGEHLTLPARLLAAEHACGERLARLRALNLQKESA